MKNEAGVQEAYKLHPLATANLYCVRENHARKF